MRNVSLRAALLVLLLAPWAAAGQAPAPVTAGPSPKVVVVSLDGAANWLVEEMLARGVLPPDGALARLARTGVRAEGMIPVTPSLTAPSHVAMFTGAYPERNGIVSNTFLAPGDPISHSTSGFEAPLEAETLWQTARHQGKRVACVTAVAADARTPERTCDWTLAYGAERGRSGVVVLAPQNSGLAGAGQESSGQFENVRRLEPTADSPALLAFQLDANELMRLEAQAVDTTADGRVDYDALLLRFAEGAGNGAVRLTPGEWVPLRLPGRGDRLGAWVMLLALASDASSARLYLGAPGENSGSPDAFVAGIVSLLGPWPGSPDERSLDRGLIDEEVWLAQAERLSRYLSDAALTTVKGAEWDLLFTYVPMIDEVEHRFLLRAPRHPDYNAEAGARRVRYAGYVDWSYRLADQLLLRLMEAAPPGTNFVVVSDHGMIPVHTQVLVNAALEQAGFRVTPDDSTEVRALTSGTTAHIYINLSGRRPGGVVPPEKYEETVERIVAALSVLRDPVTDEPVFEVVRRRSELGEFHLDNERSGDVWATARPGFYTSARLEPGATILQPAPTSATHGNLSHHRRVQAIFFAAGPQVKPGPLGTINGVDVAPTVAGLLGIEPPADTQGRAVLEPVR